MKELVGPVFSISVVAEPSRCNRKKNFQIKNRQAHALAVLVGRSR
jgi:hypothetical protein